MIKHISFNDKLHIFYSTVLNLHKNIAETGNKCIIYSAGKIRISSLVYKTRASNVLLSRVKCKLRSVRNENGFYFAYNDNFG